MKLLKHQKHLQTIVLILLQILQWSYIFQPFVFTPTFLTFTSNSEFFKCNFFLNTKEYEISFMQTNYHLCNLCCSHPIFVFLRTNMWFHSFHFFKKNPRLLNRVTLQNDLYSIICFSFLLTHDAISDWKFLDGLLHLTINTFYSLFKVTNTKILHLKMCLFGIWIILN